MMYHLVITPESKKIKLVYVHTQLGIHFKLKILIESNCFILN